MFAIYIWRKREKVGLDESDMLLRTRFPSWPDPGAFDISYLLVKKVIFFRVLDPGAANNDSYF